MADLVLGAYWQLIRFDVHLARGNFAVLYNEVRKHPVCAPVNCRYSMATVCDSVNMACIWYWKIVLCLQRSAATACLLRNCGFPAELVIGAQQMPFKAHAWVEVDRQVVNDKPHTLENYSILARC
jgi:hypothetical protein